ncbi:MAG: ABC transporter ATP-binding protein [candidate division Zixibacteria bacterium]|nr:ABC transporter ATP-binding protein [candidate division Zixibacteria bacterium]
MARKSSIRPLFFKYFNRYYRNWGLGVLAIAGTTAFGVVVPLIIKRAIDDLQSGKPLNAIMYNALLLVGLTALSGLCRFFMRQTMIVASRKVEYDIRNDFFTHLEALDRSFYHKETTGDIMSRATNDLEAVRAMYGPGLMHFTSTFFMVTMAMILMYHVDPVMTTYSFIPLPLLSVTVLIIGKQVYKRYRKIQEHYGKISAYVQENLSGIRVVQSFVQEKNQTDGFDKLNKDYIRKNMNMIKVWGMFMPVLSLIAGGLMVLILVVGGQRVINGEISLGTFVAFTAYLLMLIWPMIALGWVIGLFQRGMASMDRMNRIFNEKPLIKLPSKPIEMSQLQGDIEIKNLSFSFKGNKSKVLEDISFTVKAGQTVSVVGATGSGKTSLVSLLPRLYPIPDGIIFLDGVDINSIDLKILRSNIGYIPQDNFLFSQTLSDNISFGTDRDVDDDEIIRTGRNAGLIKDLEILPEKYDTMIGERGITLSGGQKQRISIARAIIDKPPILIFDDAFSSVDTNTEEQILNNLSDLMKASTVFLISHRISTVKNADLIIVLENGRLVESGNHDSLLSLNGVYARIHKKQLLVEELERLD